MSNDRVPDPVAVETMLASVDSQARLIPSVLQYAEPQVRAATTAIKAGSVEHLFLTGCGDSLYAAMAARLAFEKFSGLRVEAIEALEFSRYSVDTLPGKSAVVGISAGGDKSRTIEAVAQAKRSGAVTVALTGTPDSPLARAADHVLIQNERDLRPSVPSSAASNGVFALGNYLASMTVLFDLALQLGVAGGKIPAARRAEALKVVNQAATIIEATISKEKTNVRDFARSVSSAAAFYIVGGGPSYATALFGAAKLFEMPQALGVAVQLEEWAHEQFFLTRPDTVFFAVVPPGASVDRAREQIEGARAMGARIAVICDVDDQVSGKLADVSFRIGGALPEEFSPLTYCVPLELFAAYLCEAQGRAAFAFISPTQHEVNMRLIGKSQIRP